MKETATIKGGPAGTVYLLTPYNQDFVLAFKELVPYTDRVWQAEGKCWKVGEQHLPTLLPLLGKHWEVRNELATSPEVLAAQDEVRREQAWERLLLVLGALPPGLLELDRWSPGTVALRPTHYLGESWGPLRAAFRAYHPAQDSGGGAALLLPDELRMLRLLLAGHTKGLEKVTLSPEVPDHGIPILASDEDGQVQVAVPLERANLDLLWEHAPATALRPWHLWDRHVDGLAVAFPALGLVRAWLSKRALVPYGEPGRPRSHAAFVEAMLAQHRLDAFFAAWAGGLLRQPFPSTLSLLHLQWVPTQMTDPASYHHPVEGELAPLFAEPKEWVRLLALLGHDLDTWRAYRQGLDQTRLSRAREAFEQVKSRRQEDARVLLDGKTVAELRLLCQQVVLPAPTKAKKADLVTALLSQTPLLEQLMGFPARQQCLDAFAQAQGLPLPLAEEGGA